MGGTNRREVIELFRRLTVARFHELQGQRDYSNEGYAISGEPIEPQSLFRWKFHRIIAVRKKTLISSVSRGLETSL